MNESNERSVDYGNVFSPSFTMIAWSTQICWSRPQLVFRRNFMKVARFMCCPKIHFGKCSAAIFHHKKIPSKNGLYSNDGLFVEFKPSVISSRLTFFLSHQKLCTNFRSSDKWADKCEKFEFDKSSFFYVFFDRKSKLFTAGYLFIEFLWPLEWINTFLVQYSLSG